MSKELQKATAYGQTAVLAASQGDASMTWQAAKHAARALRLALGKGLKRLIRKG